MFKKKTNLDRRALITLLGASGLVPLAGCLEDETEVGVEDNNSSDNSDPDIEITKFSFELDEADSQFTNDDIIFTVEIQSNIDEEESVSVDAELYEDDLLLDDVGLFITAPAGATVREESQFFDFEPADVDRVTDYIIRVSGSILSDPEIIDEGTGDEFRDNLGE